MRSWLGSRTRRSRRLAEALVTVAAALLVAGVLIGTNLGPDRVDATNGLTWLAEDDLGEVIQANPATGRPETRLAVASAGDGLSIAQTETLLVVTNTTTGRVIVIDTATLTTGGSHQGRPENTRILLHGADLYAVDLARGRIARLDPGTAQIIGAVWTSDRPLADAAIDGSPSIWALDVTGALHQLTWSVDMDRLVDASPTRTVAGTGAASVLVPHERGVTVVAPESGRLVQIGTDRDTTVTATLGNSVSPAGDSPADLVAVSSSADGTVTLLTDSATSRTVNTRDRCPHPSRPVVHNHEVYVACDTGRILVLDRDGRVIREIAVPAGTTPELTRDDGILYICSPGAQCRYVDAQGVVRELSTLGEQVPVRTPDPPRPTTPRQQSSAPNGPRGTTENPTVPVTTTTVPVTTVPVTTTPPPPPPPRPQNGDTVITAVPGTVYSDGAYRYREYSATLAPPPLWQSFGGGCTLRVQGAGSLAQDLPIACSAPSAYLGVGDGAAYSLTVRACDALGCATSAPYSVTTIEPIELPNEIPPCRGCQIP